MSSSEKRNRFDQFSHSEMLWIALALALAQVQCAQGGDPELTNLFGEATAAVPAARKGAEF